MAQKLINLLLIATVAGATCGALALAQDGMEPPAPGLLPDSPLYFIKVIIRGIGNLFTFGAEAKLYRSLELAEEKLLEAHALAKKGKVEFVDRAIGDYGRLAEKAKERLEKIKTDSKGMAVKIEMELMESLTKHRNILEAVLARTPEAAKAGVERAIENARRLLEKIMVAGPTMSFINISSDVRQDQTFNVVWRVEVEKEQLIKHTAIHYDYESHPGSLRTEIDPAGSGYPNLTEEFAQKESKIPANFSAKIISDQAGVLYMRAHSIIDGKNYWSEERSVKVAPAVRLKASELEKEIKEFLNIEETLKIGEEKSVEQMPTKSLPTAPSAPIQFVVDGDDQGLYPATIIVTKGDLVEITFKTRAQGTYYGGLDFIGTPYFNTGTVPPGGAKTVKFTADQTFEYRSYWPSSNVLKATGRVTVL